MTHLDEALTHAKALHTSGQMSEAEELYRQIVAAHPDSFEAHYFLGATCHALGKIDEAIARLERATQLRGDDAAAQHHLGLLLAQQGNLDDAVARLALARRLAPNAAAIAEHLQQVTSARDRRSAAALTEQGKLDAAAACYRRILEANSQDAGAHNNLGIVLQMQGRFAEAAASYRRAIELNSSDVGALNNLGTALHRQGERDEAVQIFRRAVDLAPQGTLAYHNLAPLLHAQEKVDAAVACYRRILELAPHRVDTHYDLGVELQKMWNFDEAVIEYERVLELYPGHYDALNNLGIIAAERGQVDEAIALHRRAIALKADHADAHQNLGLVLLLQGNLAEGFKEYEWRLKVSPPGGSAIGRTVWTGEPIPDGTILLRAEQGLGDTLQFVRYAELVKQRVGRVVVECQKPVTLLVATCAGVDQVVAMNEPPGECDLQVSLLSLPGIFGTRLDDIPARVPYLSTDPQLVRQWQAELAEPGVLRIGIAWQGSRVHGRDRFRSIPLAEFEPIWQMPRIRIYSLQMGHGREQLESLAPDVAIRDLGDRLGDFYSTAAVVRNLDLVITCDSSPAHLAGALGIPVWVALPFAPDWRWLLARSDSPWYPTMRLFRQSSPGDWQGVFQRIAAELGARLKAQG